LPLHVWISANKYNRAFRNSQSFLWYDLRSSRRGEPCVRPDLERRRTPPLPDYVFFSPPKLCHNYRERMPVILPYGPSGNEVLHHLVQGGVEERKKLTPCSPPYQGDQKRVLRLRRIRLRRTPLTSKISRKERSGGVKRRRFSWHPTRCARKNCHCERSPAPFGAGRSRRVSDSSPLVPSLWKTRACGAQGQILRSLRLWAEVNSAPTRLKASSETAPLPMIPFSTKWRGGPRGRGSGFVAR
jgi:hypothetical protein